MTEGDHPTEVTPERVQRYLDLTARARAKATPLPDEGTAAWDDLQRLLRMADDYASDAKHFLDTGDLVRAFGAINYAHAWIDAGVRLRLLTDMTTTSCSRSPRGRCGGAGVRPPPR